MSVINGNATKDGNGRIDYVLLFDWQSGDKIAKITPTITGNWHFEYYRPHQCGITYIANGYAPITHGPYNLQGVLPDTVIIYYTFTLTDSNLLWNYYELVNGAYIDDVGKFNSKSVRIEAPGQYLTTIEREPIFEQDYCIEMFVKAEKVDSITLFDTRTPDSNKGIAIQSTSADSNNMYGIYGNGKWLIPSGSLHIDTTDWVHVAVTRRDTTLMVFVNGNKLGEGIDNTNYTDNFSLLVGNNTKALSSHYIVGNIDEICVTVGDAKYTSNFNPITKQLFDVD